MSRQLEDQWTRLLGRPPSARERAKLLHIRDAIGLRDDDALWATMIVLEHYVTLYERIPQQIAEASKMHSLPSPAPSFATHSRASGIAIVATVIAILYSMAYAIQSRESGYAAGYAAGHAAALSTASARSDVPPSPPLPF